MRAALVLGAVVTGAVALILLAGAVGALPVDQPKKVYSTTCTY